MTLGVDAASMSRTHRGQCAGAPQARRSGPGEGGTSGVDAVTDDAGFDVVVDQPH